MPSKKASFSSVFRLSCGYNQNRSLVITMTVDTVCKSLFVRPQLFPLLCIDGLECHFSVACWVKVALKGVIWIWPSRDISSAGGTGGTVPSNGPFASVQELCLFPDISPARRSNGAVMHPTKHRAPVYDILPPKFKH